MMYEDKSKISGSRFDQVNWNLPSIVLDGNKGVFRGIYMLAITWIHLCLVSFGVLSCSNPLSDISVSVETPWETQAIADLSQKPK